MLKLRAWADHSLPSANERMHERIPQDEDDIQETLRISVSVDIVIHSISPTRRPSRGGASSENAAAPYQN
jgi:hypothetical protein